jgi:pantoate--beta-alanine ligase
VSSLAKKNLFLEIKEVKIMIKTIKKVSDWKKIREEEINNGKYLGFVPTMGALHEGHFSLIRQSKKDNDKTIVSIFVNPTQFNDKKDLKKYPRNLEEDKKKLKKEGVQYLFLPDYETLYVDNYNFKICEKNISSLLCGVSRKGHFEGVLTVVMKLLLITGAGNAYFGEKDYQQYLLIKNMAEAFFLDTKIIACPTVREKDGLALSSRNVLLSSQERLVAGDFYKELKKDVDVQVIKKNLVKKGFEVEYIKELLGRRFGAVKLGKVRLIDNVKI